MSWTCKAGHFNPSNRNALCEESGCKFARPFSIIDGQSADHYTNIDVKPPALMPTAAATFATAHKLISGDRRDSYGDVKDSFQRLSLILSGILHHKLKEPLTPHEACLCCIGLKLSRESNKPSEDNRVDLCGYTGLASELANT